MIILEPDKETFTASVGVNYLANYQPEVDTK